MMIYKASKTQSTWWLHFILVLYALFETAQKTRNDIVFGVGQAWFGNLMLMQTCVTQDTLLTFSFSNMQIGNWLILLTESLFLCLVQMIRWSWLGELLLFYVLIFLIEAVFINCHLTLTLSLQCHPCLYIRIHTFIYISYNVVQLCSSTKWASRKPCHGLRPG